MSKNDRKSPRSLFKRATDNLPPLALTERDLDILEMVEEYRLLNTPQVHALIRGHPRSLSSRLSALFHHGYLDRPIHQLQLRIEEQSPLIYSLSRKGARMLSEKRLRHDVLARVSRRVAQGKSPYLAHSVMVSQFRACLSLACQETGDVAFTRWQIPERRLAQVVLAGYKVPVIPDAHFSLSQEGLSAYFFLEADRGTMSHARFLRKLQAYWQLRQTQLEGFPVRAFRVLTITTSAKRMKNLLDASRRADSNQTGSLMFYFTCEDTYSLKYPEVLLAPIWRSPGDDNVHSLLEGKSPAS